MHLSQISWIECNKEYKRLFFKSKNNNNFFEDEMSQIKQQTLSSLSSSQGREGRETGNSTKIVLVSGHSNEAFFTPSCSPAENKKQTFRV